MNPTLQHLITSACLAEELYGIDECERYATELLKRAARPKEDNRMQTKKIRSSMRYICDHCNQKYHSAAEAEACMERHMDDYAEEHKLQTAWEEATIEQRIDALMGALTNHCNVPLARIIEAL